MFSYVTGCLCRFRIHSFWERAALKNVCAEYSTSNKWCQRQCSGRPTCGVRQTYCTGLPTARYECVITCNVYVLKSAAHVVQCSHWQQIQSLDKPLENHEVFFIRGNVFPRDWVYYLGLHLPTWAVESDKYSDLNSGDDVGVLGWARVKVVSYRRFWLAWKLSVCLDEPSLWIPLPSHLVGRSDDPFLSLRGSGAAKGRPK